MMSMKTISVALVSAAISVSAMANTAAPAKVTLKSEKTIADAGQQGQQVQQAGKKKHKHKHHARQQRAQKQG